MVLTNRWLNINMKTLEADTRRPTWLFLHLAHEAYQGHKKVFIRTIDSEIVVLALSCLRCLQNYGLSLVEAKAIGTFLSIFHTDS